MAIIVGVDTHPLRDGPGCRKALFSTSTFSLIGKNVSLEIQSIELDGEAIVITAEVGGDGFNGPSHVSFLVDGDRVSRMTIRA